MHHPVDDLGELFLTNQGDVAEKGGEKERAAVRPLVRRFDQNCSLVNRQMTISVSQVESKSANNDRNHASG